MSVGGAGAEKHEPYEIGPELAEHFLGEASNAGETCSRSISRGPASLGFEELDLLARKEMGDEAVDTLITVCGGLSNDLLCAAIFTYRKSQTERGVGTL